ncbi:cytochrome P450 2K6-like [Heteronotia binoei]|uniref:cytochrome P450 2K6-like n=1 Tax=Heteronotia binoei TaxID=13085 RepID=UPI002931911F|nr:cytochrome P450 2K6-like [Heteronotia binoei]
MTPIAALSPKPAGTSLPSNPNRHCLLPPPLTSCCSFIILQLSKEYGPVFSFHTGPQQVVVLAGYETIKEALVNQADAFSERPQIPIHEDCSNGYGIIFSHGENWKVMRRFAISSLQEHGMGKKTIEDKIAEECHFLRQKFESFEGKPFDPIAVASAAAGSIITTLILGKRYGYEDHTFVRLLNLVKESNRVLAHPLVTVYNLFPSLGSFVWAHKEVLRKAKEMKDSLQHIIREHLKDLDENNKRSLADSFFIRQQEEEKNKINGFFHNSNLVTLVNHLFCSGMAPVSATLCWALLLMIRYPEIQNKARKEITEVIGSSQPRIEHQSQLPYTNAVIHEIQRFADIYPVGMPHETTTDVTLKGYFIPKGTHIVPLLYSVLYDESRWEKPFEFYPEHFLDSEGKFVERDAFLPFSAGRRMCPGKSLAKMEIFLFFTSLLQQFIFQPAPGISSEDVDLTPMAGFSSTPLPFKLCALLRS